MAYGSVETVTRRARKEEDVGPHVCTLTRVGITVRSEELEE